MEIKAFFVIVAFLLGAAFVMTDISTDSYLLIDYLNQWSACPNYTIDCSWKKAPLGPIAKHFAIVTGLWIGLGGVFQFAVAVFLTVRNAPDNPFKRLPLQIRYLVLGSSLILLSPVILNLYGAYTVIQKGVSDVATVQIPMVIANLKLAEIILESVIFP